MTASSLGLASLKALTGLAAPIIKFGISKAKNIPAIYHFRIEKALESSIAEVWCSLENFFDAENIPTSQREILARECFEELYPFSDKIEELLANSMDGELLFEHLRQTSGFPQAIQDEKLEPIYRMVFPVVASVLFRSTVIIEQIEHLEFHEILTRFDALTAQLNSIIFDIQKINSVSVNESDDLFNRVLRQSLRKVLLNLEVTGLYGDVVIQQAKDDMFVLPEIWQEDRASVVSNRDDTIKKIKVQERPQHTLYFQGRSQRNVVRGGPGAGKSTWSRWLQAEAIRDQKTLTLYVKLRAFVNSSVPTIIELLHDLVGSNMAPEINAKIVRDWISNGKIGVICDGFDEISPDLRDVFLEQIVEVSSFLETGPCLITSRPLNSDHLDKLSSHWKSWQIQQFDERRILEYIEKWYNFVTLKEGKSQNVRYSELYNVLVDDPHIEPLTGNPLMLSTLLMVHHNDGELPKGRSKLYGRYIDGMLGIWDDKQRIKADNSGLNRDQKKRILTSMAIAFHLDDKDEIEERSAIEIIAAALNEFGYISDPSLVIDSLRERSGLIVGPGSYSFSHKSISEYLVSQAIIEGNRSFGSLKIDRYKLSVELSNDKWLNVIYFWAGSAPVMDVQTMIEKTDLAKQSDLVVGLLWDQIDRFQKEWLARWFENCLRYWDRCDWKDKDEAHHGRSYFSWWFRDKPPYEERGWASIPGLPIRHVGLGAHSADRVIKDLFARCEMGWERIDLLKNDGVYKMCVAAHLPWRADASDLGSIIKDKIKRWPDWLKCSQYSLRLAACYDFLGCERLVEHWNSCFPELVDQAPVWLLAGIVVLGSGGLRYFDDGETVMIAAIMDILSLSWTADAVKLAMEFQAEIETNRSVNLFRSCVKMLDEHASVDDVSAGYVQLVRRKLEEFDCSGLAFPRG